MRLIIRHSLLTLLLCSTTSIYLPLNAQQGVKKKILLFSGHGGGGHLAAASAIRSYLINDYNIEVAFMFDEVLKETDIVQRISQGRMTGDEFYNFLIKKKWHLLLNKLYDAGKISFKVSEPHIENILFAYLDEKRPDLIISVIPFVNNIILQTAQILNIPFLLIPTDLDPTMALIGVKKPAYEKFKLGLAYNAAEINEKIKKNLIPKAKISYIGFPVRPCLLDKNFCKSIDEFNIPTNKPVVLLLMGSQGSKELYKYAKEFTKVTVPIHLLVAIGKSEIMRTKINSIKFPPNITYTVVGFTDKMPELLRRADVFVSKSGGVSVNEGIYANVPMLLDASSTLLRWEKFSIDFVVKHKFGKAIKHISPLFGQSFSDVINTLFSDKTELNEYKKNLIAFQKPNPQIAIKELVESLIQ